MLVSIPCLLGIVAPSAVLAMPAAPQTLSTRSVYTAPRLVNYVQTFHDVDGNPLDLTKLLSENTQITHVNLAALHINDDPNGITLNDVNPNSTYWDTVWSNVTALQNGGIKVLMMMGGAAPGSYPRLCGTAVPAVIVRNISQLAAEICEEHGLTGRGIHQDEAYYSVLRDTIKYHKLDGMDLDIEEAVDVSCALALLQRLDTDFGSDFILTMAPVASALMPAGPGLSGFDYTTLDSQATSSTRPNGKLVTWYNAQFYNGWGDASTQVNYDALITAGNWLPDRIVMGVLDNENDGGSGFVPISTLMATIKQLRVNYPSFGCAVGWEYWDAGGDDGFAQPWEWVKAVAGSVFGVGIEMPAANLTNSPVPNAPPPFPLLTQTLVDLGATWPWAVWALNVSDGGLAEAEQLLLEAKQLVKLPL
ncbi:hypothetical protein LTR62_005817 [Meristemomyces frigidus]|uniref:GH18 domain-containing protein n=1 Tax=Meristemomyces frigidus TaxID=1508187 RepID=A0AAN7YF11_9PEZI|nr:hypothetical protein LTR62_005817 [Meristemomyces frigidus]